MLFVSLLIALFIPATLLDSTQATSQQHHHKHQPPVHQTPTPPPASKPQPTTLKYSTLIKHPNQRSLIEKYPGTLMAVARALKMAKVECQYQMRHEPWDCPIFELDVKPDNMFGKLTTRSFRETSFIHSLLSAALAHSVTRACSDSMIQGCYRIQRSQAIEDNIHFGVWFAQKFMDATHELSLASQTHNNIIDTTITTNSNSNSNSNSREARHARNTPNNNRTSAASSSSSSSVHLATRGGNSYATGSSAGGRPAQTDLAYSPGVDSNSREQKIRHLINAHNDEAGILYVINSMRRECKCHGLSAACTLQTCWNRLSPFREVATKLYQNLDRAIRVVYVSQYPAGSNRKRQPLISSPLSSTSLSNDMSAKKSNKKRSSSQHQPNFGGSAPKRSLQSADYRAAQQQQHQHQHQHPLSHGPYLPPGNSLTGNNDPATIIGNRRRDYSKSHANQSKLYDELGAHLPSAQAIEGGDANNLTSRLYSERASESLASLTPYGSAIMDNSISIRGHNASNLVKKMPVARSIGIELSIRSPNKDDLLYAESSPDFCEPNEAYNIKGTKGRACSENKTEPNSCERLCCGRGYRTEVRDEKYNCDCVFRYCCQLDCKTCTRRKMIHKCL